MTGAKDKTGDEKPKVDPFKPLDKNSSVMLGSCFKIIDPPKRAWKPPLAKPEEEPRDVLLALRNEATRAGIPWTLEDTTSDIRFSLNFYHDKIAGTHKRQPKFFEPLLSNPDTEVRKPPKPSGLSEEEKAAALKRKMADPLQRVHASCMNMGLPFGKFAVTTNKKVNEVTETSRRNVKLMDKLALIDESAQRLQAMLREETASVPGQQIPDKARTTARKQWKADMMEETIMIATHDFSPRRKSRGADSAISGGSSTGGRKARSVASSAQ